MYLVGAAHPHKTDAQQLLERLISAKQRLVCDAEVLQEITHRYSAIDRREAIAPALAAVLSIVDEVYPIERVDVLRAAEIVSGRQNQSARDALHISIMERYGIRQILSFDRDYDRWPGLDRIWKL